MKRFFHSFLWVAVLFFNAACGSGLSSVGQDRTVYGNIKIIGSGEFVTQTIAALALLEHQDQNAFVKVQKYIGVIQQSERSGMWVWENPPRYEVSDATAFSSLTWYASTIAHDATHSELYAQYKLTYGEPVPGEAYSSVDIEILCNQYQLSVLKRLNAPQSELDYMATLDGTHCDLDGDGDCDFDDYQMRNW